MKTIRSGLSNGLVLAALAGLALLLISLFSSANSSPTTLGSSPIATPTGVQISPLSTPSVPVARIGAPVLLQASGPLGLLNQAPDKFINIGGEKGTVLLDPANGLTRTLATTGLINAHASGHWLVYEDRPSSESPALYYSRIKIVDLNTGKEVLLGDQSANQYEPQISGNIVVWDEPRNGKLSRIYAYDLATNKTFSVAVGEGVRGHPLISGQWIAYIHWLGQNPTGWEGPVELRAYSLATGEDLLVGLMPMTKDSWALSRYTIDGDKVVWTKQTSSIQYTYELHLYDLTTRTDRQLTQPQQWPLAGISLSTKSGLVAFNNDGQRMVLDWLQPEPASVSVTPPVQAQWGYELSVAGDYLVWQIPRGPDYSDGQIFVSRISR